MELKTEPLPYGAEHGLESVGAINVHDDDDDDIDDDGDDDDDSQLLRCHPHDRHHRPHRRCCRCRHQYHYDYITDTNVKAMTWAIEKHLFHLITFVEK